MLSEVAVRNAKARDKDYKLADSEGLYLFVTKAGHRSWRLKYRFAGKERRLIFGSYPEVSLKDARERKLKARKLLSEGRDPGIEAKKASIGRSMAAANTYEIVARNWFALQEDRWTPVHARDVITSLENEVFPWLGSLPIAEIDEPLVLTVLRKVEKRGAIETAHRVRQRMSAVFVHGIAEGVASRDPAAVVGKALKPVPRSKKRPAILRIEGLQDLIRKTEVEPASPLTKLASRIAALTGQRLGAIRTMTWTQLENIDWVSDDECPAALWRIPASHMKLATELKRDDTFDHLAPLAPEAVAALRAVYQLTGRGPLVFPSNRSARIPMSENTLSYFYNRCGYLVRTGMGALAGSAAWNLHHHGFGPSWDGMFCQSNFGVVTKLGMWLMPEPEAVAGYDFEFDKIDDLGWAIDTIMPLRRSGLIRQSPSIGNWLRSAAVMTRRADWTSQPGPLDESVVTAIRERFNIGCSRVCAGQCRQGTSIARSFSRHCRGAGPECSRLPARYRRTQHRYRPRMARWPGIAGARTWQRIGDYALGGRAGAGRAGTRSWRQGHPPAIWSRRARGTAFVFIRKRLTIKTLSLYNYLREKS